MKLKNFFLMCAFAAPLTFVACHEDDEKYDVVCESAVVEYSNLITGDFDGKGKALYDSFNEAKVKFAEDHTHKYRVEADSYEIACIQAGAKYLKESYQNDLKAAQLFVDEWQAKLDTFSTKGITMDISLYFQGRGLYVIGEYDANGTILKIDDLDDLKLDTREPE